MRLRKANENMKNITKDPKKAKKKACPGETNMTKNNLTK